MMGRSPRCYIPSFMKISLPVLAKKIFEGFLPYMGVSAILVMLPGSCKQIFISLYMKAFIQNLVQNGPVVSEKIRLEFLYVHNLGPWSSNDLDLQYSHTFMKSLVVCIYQLSGHRLQQFLKNPLFSLFPIEKPKFPNLTLP